MRAMIKKLIVFSIIILWALFLFDVPVSVAQTDLFDGRVNVLFKLEEYIVWREKRPRSQHVQLSNRITMWRHRAQAEILWKIYDKDETNINLFTWVNYFYEMGPDINRRIHKAMPHGHRYKDYQSPFWDSDDMLHEFYLDINRGPLTVRVGKQAVIWGEMEQQRTTDIINPLDLRYSSPGIDDMDELKMPIWMLRIMHQTELPGELAFDFIFNPGDYQQIRLGIQGTDRGAPSVPNEELGGMGIVGALQELKNKSEPRFALSNYEIGFRVTGLYTLMIADQYCEFVWKLMYFNGLDDVMIINNVKAYGEWIGDFAVARVGGGREMIGSYAKKVEPEILPLPTRNIYDAKRFNMFGLSLETYDPILTKAVIICEFAYFKGINYNSTVRPGDATLGKIERDYFTYGLLFSRAVRTLFLKKLDHKSQGFVNVDISIFQGWHLGNVSRIKKPFSYKNRSETAFTLMLRTHFLNQTFTPVIRALYNTRNWGYISVSCTVSLTTSFKFALGFNETFSNNRTHSGIASGFSRDRFYLKIKYQF
jgi:hypothetical protein